MTELKCSPRPWRARKVPEHWPNKDRPEKKDHVYQIIDDKDNVIATLSDIWGDEGDENAWLMERAPYIPMLLEVIEQLRGTAIFKAVDADAIAGMARRNSMIPQKALEKMWDFLRPEWRTKAAVERKNKGELRK